MKTVLIVIGIIIVLAFLLTLGTAFLVKFAKKKNIPVDTILEDTQTALNTAETVSAAISPLFPAYAPILKTVLYYVGKFVTHAEALWNTNTTGTEIDRKTVAMADITAALTAKGFTVDADMTKFIDAVVEMFVRSLPKSHTVAEVVDAVAPAAEAAEKVVADTATGAASVAVSNPTITETAQPVTAPTVKSDEAQATAAAQ